MQLTNYGALSLSQFRAEGALFTTFPQPQETDQNVLNGIFVRQKRFPTAVGHIISPDQLHRFRADAFVDFLNADFSCAHVSTPSSMSEHTYIVV